MQAIKCSGCRQLIFMYDGDVRVSIKSAKATYPDGSKPLPGRFIRRPCGCDTKVYGRADSSLYIDGEMETPNVTIAES